MRTPIDAVKRYQTEYDLLIQEIQADESLREDLDRRAIWQKIQKAVDAFCDSINPPWNADKRETFKNQLLDSALAALQKRKPASGTPL